MPNAIASIKSTNAITPVSYTHLDVYKRQLLPLVQLFPTVAAAAAVLFALPRTVPVLAAVPEKLTTVVEQPVDCLLYTSRCV